ncbi:MAG: DUF4382 domain-containing protein [Pseudomonadota bacterium]
MQKVVFAVLAFAIAASALMLGGCSCGFDCNNDDNGTTSLTLGFSDALPEELKQVVIEVDSITLTRSNGDDVVVDEFTIPQLGLVSVDTFQVDLLQYRGRNQLVVFEDLEFPAGTYNQVRVAVLTGDINNSYVEDANDTLRELTVPNSVLTVSGTNFARSNQVYTIEFGLAQSLRSLANGTRYEMNNTGIRLENNATAASLSGRVDSSLFDTVSPCDEKEDPTAGNRIYLYDGRPSSNDRLGDVFTSASSTVVPDNVVPPVAVASLVFNSLTATWEYVFGFLSAGEYTMAFACNTAADDSVNWDDLIVPQPDNQSYDILLTEGESGTCDITESGSC